MGWSSVRARVWGLAIGVSVTLTAVLLYRAGRFDWLEHAAADWHFRHLGSIDASPDIVMIDINDFAMERVHRWPWPRALHAELVDVLRELGAARILMDIVFSEPMRPRLEHPALGPDHDVDPPGMVYGEVHLSDAVYDDDALAAAMRRAGMVYLAMFCRLSPPGLGEDERLMSAGRILADAPALTPADFAARLGAGVGEDSEDLLTRARIFNAVRDDLAASGDQIAAGLNLPSEVVDRHLAEVKQLVFRGRMHEHLERHPDTTFQGVLRLLLPDIDRDRESPDRRELLRAFRACRSLNEILKDALPVPPSLDGRIPDTWDVTPPLDKLAAAARAGGIVTFEKDADGVLRRVPLLINVRGKLVKQLGFALACDYLDIDDASFAMDTRGFLTMSDRAGENAWRARLDGDGMAILNWHIDRDRPQWQHSFRHIAVSRVMEVALNRRAIAHNDALIGLRTADAVRARFAEQPAAYAEYERLVRERNALQSDRSPLTAADGADPGALDDRIAAIETATLEWLAFAVRSLDGLEPESPDEAAEFETYRGLARDLVDGRLRRDVAERNAELRRRNAEILEQLRPLIAGKLCFVGYTASAVADMVATPPFESVPGVMAHANLVNTLIGNRFPRMAPPLLNRAMLVAAGLAVALITTSRGPWISLVSVLLVAAFVLVGGAWLFRHRAYLVAGSVAAVTAFVCWALVTMYRQLTEERHKRNLSRALARNTSPAIAGGIVRRFGQLDLAPRPAEVTCYFSDLQGFTSLSERLGPTDTQIVLNRYLERMSDVLVPHGAFSKFMGDGIFAFFNAPLLPAGRHAETACEVALRCVEALTALKTEHRDDAHAAVFRDLVMRAGLHTGPAYVGEFGSEHQTDYTCIGDTVNLAARLEGANKVFGTSILVSQSCREAVSDAFAFRCLGRLQVKGKEHAVEVYELVDRSADAGPELLDYARRFADAVAQFQQRRFADARRAFEQCVSARPADAAARVFLAETTAYLDQPPGADWNRSIQLSHK